MRPVNKHLLVELTKQDNKTSVLVPDEYTAVKQYEIVKIVDCSADAEKFSAWDIDNKVVVPGNMLISFSVGEKEYHLIQENYVLAAIDKGE